VREPELVPDEVLVRLDELCIVHGCLNLRTGRNLCRAHEFGDEPRELHRCPACTPGWKEYKR
jgi:hypothetical protein